MKKKENKPNEVYTDLEKINVTGDKALRFNNGKPRWALADFEALVPMIEVLEFGAKKYDAHNWKKGLKTTGICESMLRHIYAYLAGEDKDPDSGIHHVGHILCNAMFLSHMVNREDMDDRFKGHDA